MLALFLAAAATGCQEVPQQYADKTHPPKFLKKGVWRAELQLKDIKMPFNFEVLGQDTSAAVFLVNGDERIKLDGYKAFGDSVIIPMHIFNTRLVAYVQDTVLNGYWEKSDFDGYRLPFEAVYGHAHRFSTKHPDAGHNITGKWAVEFLDPKSGKPEKAVGLFDQQRSALSGTFLTTTGDYRFLAGELNGDSLLLSCFDGEHAFLFRAAVKDGNTLVNGGFWSGKNWHQAWRAKRDSTAELPDASSLTFLKKGHNKLSFQFPNLDRQLVSLDDARFKDKVVIVQIMGTWCPNCMDETAFLAPFHKKNQARGLEVIGLAYERSLEFDKAKERLLKLKNRFDIGYELLVAGVNDKAKAAETLPMLNHVLAFPTTIFIDRKGQVRKIHTGFSGPGTGDYYEVLIEEFNQFVNKLLNEESL